MGISLLKAQRPQHSAIPCIFAFIIECISTSHTLLLHIGPFYIHMKGELHGTLNLNKKNGKWLGLRNVFEIELQLTPSFIINKPIFLQKTTLTRLQIPIVQKNVVVKYIDSKPFHMYAKIITRSRILGFHPIDVYMNWPSHFENMTYIE
jgi:hypothetical protein